MSNTGIDSPWFLPPPLSLSQYLVLIKYVSKLEWVLLNLSLSPSLSISVSFWWSKCVCKHEVIQFISPPPPLFTTLLPSPILLSYTLPYSSFYFHFQSFIPKVKYVSKSGMDSPQFLSLIFYLSLFQYLVPMIKYVSKQLKWALHYLYFVPSLSLSLTVLFW